MALTLIGLVMMLVGGAMVETPLMSSEFGWPHIIAGIVFGALFFVPGLILFKEGAKELLAKLKNHDLEDIKEALKPGYKEAGEDAPYSKTLKTFREHYSNFFCADKIGENDPIQSDVTQVFRNMMDFRKNRLKRLGITCEVTARRMIYDRENGVSAKGFNDGKYDIIEVQEEIAGKTVYKKGGKDIHTKMDKDIANYTLIHAKKGEDKTIICPSCGVVTTRDALLDGCDYCGTKFTVEDLGTRVAEFGFRPDYKLQLSKYKNRRNKIMKAAIICIVIAVIAMFTGMAFYYGPQWMADGETGIILTITAALFAIAVASPVFIIAFFIVYAGIIFPIVLALGGLDVASKKVLERKKNAPMFDSSKAVIIKKHDPNFSIANFYSGVHNKIESVVYADTKEQIEAFAIRDITNLLGKYSNVIGIDIDHMEIEGYQVDDTLQHVSVLAFLRFTEYAGKKCRARKELWRITLAKSAACKTQVVCSPAIMTCKGCGTSLDLLKGKTCAYCGRTLDLINYDWVIDGINTGAKINN